MSPYENLATTGFYGWVNDILDTVWKTLGGNNIGLGSFLLLCQGYQFSLSFGTYYDMGMDPSWLKDLTEESLRWRVSTDGRWYFGPWDELFPVWLRLMLRLGVLMPILLSIKLLGVWWCLRHISGLPLFTVVSSVATWPYSG